MPLITITAAAPVIPAGTYPAELIAITPKSMVTQYSKVPGQPDDFLEWTWLVHTEDRDIEITSLTTTATSPLSRINEYLTALLGPDQVKVGSGFDEADLVGKSVFVQTVVQDNGFAKIDKIVAAPKARKAPAPAKAAPAPQQVALGEAPEDDDLPF